MSLKQMIKISELSQHLQFVNQCDCDNLLEKQLQARMALNKNPSARTINCQRKIEYRNLLQRTMESKVLVFDSDSNP